MLLVAALFGLVIVGGGCSTNYDETYYQGPNWTPEGLIYCQKSVTHYQKDPLGTITLGTDYSYVTMDTDGNNETTLPYNGYPYYSPKGTYVALISGKTISIIRRSDNQQVYSFSPSSDSIESLDWGPDEDKLVYLRNNGGINVVNINGTGDLNIAVSGEAIAWKYGNKIVFNYLDSIYTYTSIINYDGSGRQDIIREGRVVDPQVSQIASNEVFGTQGWAYGYININLDPPSFVQLISEFTGYRPKLSPTATKVTYGKLLDTGIWLINIDGTGLKQLK